MGIKVGKLFKAAKERDFNVESPHEKRWRPYQELPFCCTESKRSTKRKAVADDEPAQKKQRTSDPAAMLKAKYRQQKRLGKGGFGSVFAGFRKADNLPVAIKHIPRDQEILMHEDDNGKKIPTEVAVMLKLAAESEPLSAPVKLLDWYDLDRELVLVLERPMPAVDLGKYITDKGGRLKEREAKIIMRQLVDAAIDLQKKHIFHRDIKVENTLIETHMDKPRVRLIDFGLSRFDEEGDAYHIFYGTHVPPEWYRWNEYEAGPTTVYQMGTALFDMLQNPSFSKDLSQLKQRIKKCSKNCQDFFAVCLQEDPDDRCTLEELRNHRWMR